MKVDYFGQSMTRRKGAKTTQWAVPSRSGYITLLESTGFPCTKAEIFRIYGSKLQSVAALRSKHSLFFRSTICCFFFCYQAMMQNCTQNQTTFVQSQWLYKRFHLFLLLYIQRMHAACLEGSLLYAECHG